MAERNIPVLAVTARVKDVESCVSKARRTNYRNPSDIEDFVGVRIICYYVTDIQRILDLIDSEFEVENSEDKLDALAPDQFGYRSSHKVVRIKPAWAHTPNYRGLDRIKCEVQVRTIFMHAWAEISHQLSYKKSHDVPTQLARELSRLSAKLEDADEQFESIYQKARAYERDLRLELQKADPAANIELNVDSLKALLKDRYFNRRSNEESDYSELLTEFIADGFSTIQQVQKLLDENITAFSRFVKEDDQAPDDGYMDIGVVRTMLYLGRPTALRRALKDVGWEDDEISETLERYRSYGVANE